MSTLGIWRRKGQDIHLSSAFTAYIQFCISFVRWINDPFLDNLRSELESKDEEKQAERQKAAAKMEAKAQKKKELLLKSLRDDED